MHIGIIGGTGREGAGLAQRWAKAGHTVTIGSRDAARARARAAELAEGTLPIEGADNETTARAAEVVVLSVPYQGHAEIVRALAPFTEGKTVIDITVPLKPPKVREVHLPETGSAAEETRAILGSSSRLAAALHHVSSEHLRHVDHAVECDVLVCADDDATRELTIRLVEDLGLRGLDAGPLRNAVALESLTPVLLHMNKKYKATAGVRFTGIDTRGTR